MADASRATILIVDDDSSSGLLQRKQLERAGYDVTYVASAQEALARARAGGIDLAVLDYCLAHNVTGLDVFDQFQEAGHKFPVILVTAFNQESTVIDALRKGVRDFVAKSINYLDYLPEAVDRVIKQTQIEMRLAESEARFQAFMNHSPAAKFIRDESGQIVYVNPQYAEVFNLRNWQEKNVSELFAPATAERIRAVDADVLRLGKAVEYSEDVVLADGSRRQFWAQAFPIPSVGGSRLVGGTMVDMTTRWQAVTELRDSEEKFRAISESAVDAIIGVDSHGTVVTWNAAASRTFGLTHDQIVGQPLTRLIPPRLQERQRQAFQRILEHGKAALRGHPMELEGVRSDGSEFPIELSIGAWSQNDKLFFTGIVRDTTEQKLSAALLRDRDEQLRQAQKMEAIGLLAGGVAHDFNNLLTVILGYSELLLDAASPDAETRIAAEAISESANRAKALTSQLLAFSRRAVVARKRCSLNDIISNIQELLKRLITEDISLSFALAPRLVEIEVDPNQIDQVLVNLAANARDAMPDGGVLAFNTSQLDIDEQEAGSHGNLKPGTYVRLTVTDTGCGISAETIDHIFEPFFTTKAVGHGTGLGLATVYGIINQSGGHIEVDSDQNHGTEFTIYLPAARVEVTPPTDHAGEDASQLLGRNETVLVVEDEDSVRAMVAGMLQKYGYHVLQAASGSDAIQLLQDQPSRIDLVLTDVVMPEMSGRRLAELLQEQFRDLRFLFMSGYSDDAILHRGVQSEQAAFLQKPFTQRTLAEKVREVLDRAPQGASP